MVKHFFTFSVLFFLTNTIFNLALATDNAELKDTSIKPFNNDFPIGVWKSSHSNTLKDKELKSITLYSYSSDFILIKANHINGEQSLSRFKDPNYMAAGYLDHFDLDDSFKFQIISQKKINLFYEETFLTSLKKVSYKKNNLRNIVGLWTDKDKRNEIFVSIDESLNVIVTDEYEAQLGTISHNKDIGLIIATDNKFYKQRIPVKLNNNQLEIFFESDEPTTLTKVSDKPRKQTLIDNNGNPVKIDKLTLTSHFNELTIETKIDLLFTNPNKNSSEVKFKLPLPSNAILVNYSLDIDGVMVPSSAVEKSTARQAFEEIEARGVDPAIADININNQFTTEIYPVEYQQQRRIALTYIEPINKDNKGFSSYEFPLEKIGLSRETNIQLSGFTKRPQVKKLSKAFQKQWSKDNGSWTLNARSNNYDSNSPLALRYKEHNTENNSIKTSITQSLDGQQYFTAWGIKSKETKPSQKKKANNVVIAWDTSLSMKEYHQDYLDLVKKYSKLNKKANLKVMTFSNSFNKTNIYEGNSEQLIQQLKQIQYDSASDLSHLKTILDTNADYFLIFSDGLTTLKPNFAIEDKAIFSIAPPSSEINLPLLKQIAQHGNFFQLGKKNASRIAKRIGAIPSLIKIKSHSKNINDLVINRPYGFDSSFSITAKITDINLSDIEIELEYATQKVISNNTSNKNSSQQGKHLWVQSKLQSLLAFM